MSHAVIFTGNTMKTCSGDPRVHRHLECPQCYSRHIRLWEPRTGACLVYLETTNKTVRLLCQDCVHAWRVKLPEGGLVLWAL